jgi:S1-C subfamily serine protease
MSTGFMNLSNEMAQLVKVGSPSVVRIEARRHVPASGILWSADGLIVTANHVIRRDDNIIVGLPDGQSTAGTLVGRDPTTDLAVIQASGNEWATLYHADEDAMSPGHIVLALGRPGKSVQATFGIVSALAGSWRTRLGGQIDYYLQTDVTMYPGFSGGPLIGADGRLLGLNTSGLGQGVSLAVPASTLKRVVEMLQSHGRVRRGYLGVNTQRVRLPESAAAELGQKTGLLVVSVEIDSPAAEGGLTLGDTLISLGNQKITDHEDLLEALSGDTVGRKEVVKILRGGQSEELTVKIGERA